MSNLDSLAKLTLALGLDEAGIAKALGATLRTVKAWVAGSRRPSERYRIGLITLALDAQREHSAASGRRFSATRDEALRGLRVALQTAQQRAQWLADRERMRAQFLGA